MADVQELMIWRRYDQENQWLVHGGNPRCLDANPATKELFVSKCDRASLTQR